MTKSNPQAFPSSHMRKHHESRDKEIVIDHDGQEGMTLRDYFAAKAMQALFGSPHAKNASILLGDDPDNVRDVFVRRAYDIADAMLKAREQ